MDYVSLISENYLAICLIIITVNAYFGKMNNRLFLVSPAMAVIPAFGVVIDPEQQKLYIICITCILMACALRFGLLYQRNELSWKVVFLQFLITIPLCFIGFLIWEYWESKWPVHILLFFISFFSIFIVGLLEDMGKIGIKAAFRNAVRYLAAKVEEK